MNINDGQIPQQQGLYEPRFEHDACGVGFLCDIKGRKSHDIISQAQEVLKRLAHRGAVGADPKTGDGAGILIQIPHEFFLRVAAENKIDLPVLGGYGTGLVFLPPNKNEQTYYKDVFKRIVQKEEQNLLGWRQVPVDKSVIGDTAAKGCPAMFQIFVGKNQKIKDNLAFERKLYVIRRQVENIIGRSVLKQKSFFYITSLSSRTFCYKGLLIPYQLEEFFPELKSPDLKSALCLIHSRHSTNTFPSWNLAQPFRYLAHNGEINTLRGNINWMQGRQDLLSSHLFGEDIEKIKPIIIEGGSDSATIDNVFELLVLSGRSLPHAMMMLIPAAWEKNPFMDKNLRDFYKYHACFMESWDGPATISFTDGECVGAVLDRNGLRPARYIVTKQDFVVMASEVGVLDIAPSDIAVSGRLQPGKMFYIDTDQGRIVHDDEIKETLCRMRPYSVWVKENFVEFEDLAEAKVSVEKCGDIITLLKAFGYTREDLGVIIKPMAQDGQEPTGSMGNDTPHAILSKRPQLLYNYFRQLFAQVTNPAIDPIREDVVMSLESYIGPQKNILDEVPQNCHKLRVKHPILTNKELDKIHFINVNGFRTKNISIRFRSDYKEGFGLTLARIGDEAVRAIKEGHSFIILSDRGLNEEYAAIPALLAVGAVHHHLVRKAMRTQIGIIVESAQAWEVHHFALLFAYGADCVNPYLAYEAIQYLIETGELELDYLKAQKNYIKAAEKGIMKILSKMGISTLQSYRGAQIFEALGLNEEVIDTCFAGTVSRIGGLDLGIIAQEAILRHREAYPVREVMRVPYLASGGIYQWKRDGEFHLWRPESIATLQDAARKNDYEKYKEFAQLINDQSANPTTLRSLFKFKKTNFLPAACLPARQRQAGISIDQVESVEEIMKRFATGAMSFGSISMSAHETIAIAVNRIGGKSNTGEGGEDPNRFITLPNGDSKSSAIKQVASGRFGVTTNYLINADELQIKIAQGAKPGEGGQLPGHKVSVTIAKTRYTTPGVTLISPPPHHDIYSIEDLAQLIFDLKNVNPRARISVKLVSETGVGTIAAGVVKGHADMILISGGDGGTGASPKSSIRYAGLPWELGLAETHQTLLLNDLRSRVRLQADGQIRTGRDVAIAALLGAEEFGFGTAVLVVLGCVMLRHCHLNNCSLGVATQDRLLEKRFKGKPEHIVNYFNFVAGELREIMAQLGLASINEMVGRTDLLEVNEKIIPWKAKHIDFSKILYKPKVPKTVGRYCIKAQDHGIENVLDKKLIENSRIALNNAEPVDFTVNIKNTDRATGAMLSGEVCRLHGEEGLPEGIIRIKFKGVAGQSFGAWLARGITFELEGLANDYVGKGISGGKIIIYPAKSITYKPEENIIIGNTAFYGAISGEAYIRGVAGERFCIRNSGLYAVVEGVGDHGCEYMTGGRVIVLGETGRNFAAGMSGGIAYVYDEDKSFKDKCNLDMVGLESCKVSDKEIVYNLVRNHYVHTQSAVAKEVLDNFPGILKKFVKVIPSEYKRILEGKKVEEIVTEVSDG